MTAFVTKTARGIAMSRRAFLCKFSSLAAVLALAITVGSAAAQSVKLKAHEITALLQGNTAAGKWEGEEYRQFFGPDGVTIFAQAGARSTRGAWRVDAERDEYQSLWPRDTDWEGWFVMEWNGDFYWVSKKTPPTPFKVLEGQSLAFVPD